MIRFGLLRRGHIANRHTDLLRDGSIKGAGRAIVRDNRPERADIWLNQIEDFTLSSVAAEEERIYNVRLGLRPVQFPNADRYQSCILLLPMFAETAIAQQTAVIDLVRTFD